MTGLSSKGETAVLAPLTTSAFVSLHTGDPGDTGANEVTGGAYARQGPIAFTNVGSNPTVASNSAHVKFSGGDGGLGRDYVFRSVGRCDGGKFSRWRGANHVCVGQQRRYGALSRWLADDHGAMTWRRLMAKAIWQRHYSLAPIVDLLAIQHRHRLFRPASDVLVAQGDLAGDLRPLIVLSASLTADRGSRAIWLLRLF